MTWTPELDALAADARSFAQRVTAGLAIREDSWLRGVDPQVARELGRRGWLGMCWPRRWGGHERPPIERFAVVEALISHGAPLASCWFPDRQIGPTLLQFGTDEQRDEFLPDIVAGRVMPGTPLPKTLFDFAVYPNPAHDKVTIRFKLPKAGKGRLHIVNALGQELYSLETDFQAGEGSYPVFTRDLKSKGVFFAVLEMPEGKVKRLFVVE